MARTSLLPIEKRLRDILYAFCVLWTLAQMAMIVLEFLRVNRWVLPSSMPLAYFLLISAYGIRKEIDRWVHGQTKRRRGERFFWMWALMAFALYVASFVTHGEYVVPRSLLETWLYATIVYAGTGTSRILLPALKLAVRIAEHRTRRH